MKILLASIRILIIVGFTALSTEFFLGTEEHSAILEYKEVYFFLAFITIVLIAVEMILNKVDEISDSLLTEEQKAKILSEKRETWSGKIYSKMLDQKPLEKEGEIMLNHDYDGIKELDNNLPPWWVYLFYSCIAFAFFYMGYYTFGGGTSQVDEFKNEEKQAKLAIEEYKKANPNLVDAENVTVLTDAADLQAGKDTFLANCIACHAPDGGGGIGPNLTDKYWILGGGIKNVFSTITNGGREGMGMVSWKAVLSGKQRQEVASYILSLQGTTPMSPKAPQGDVWEEK